METTNHLSLFQANLREDLPPEWTAPGCADPLLEELKQLAPDVLATARSGDFVSYAKAVVSYQGAFIRALENRVARLFEQDGTSPDARFMAGILMSRTDPSLKRFLPNGVRMQLALKDSDEKRTALLFPRYGRTYGKAPEPGEWVFDAREYQALTSHNRVIPKKLMDDKPPLSVLLLVAEGTARYVPIRACNNEQHVYDWAYPLFGAPH